MGIANSHNAEFFMGEADAAVKDGDYGAASAFAQILIAISLDRIAEHLSGGYSAPALEFRRLNPLLRKIANANKGLVMVSVDDVVTARDLLGLRSETDTETGGVS